MSTDADASAVSIPSSDADEAETMLELKDEVDQLKQAVWAHATVDQAIGVIIALGKLGPDEGWEVIRNVSMRTNVKLRDVAQQIVTFARTGDLPKDLRREMKRQIRQHQQPTASPTDQQ
jgi:hypothetical protein